jgi:hypothetical protein
MVPLGPKEPPGAILRYDGRLSTPSACSRIVQVLKTFLLLLTLHGQSGFCNIFQLQCDFQVAVTQCFDLNSLILPFPVPVS